MAHMVTEVVARPAYAMAAGVLRLRADQQDVDDGYSPHEEVSKTPQQVREEKRAQEIAQVSNPGM